MFLSQLIIVVPSLLCHKVVVGESLCLHPPGISDLMSQEEKTKKNRQSSKLYPKTIQ